MSGHDIVVIGTSAGGLEGLRHLTSQLPADFPAAVFIVQHMSPHARSNLATLIGRVSALKASTAKAGDKIVHGHIYIAPSDRHMVLDDGRIELVYGPQENRHRPAIDALFRSAAAHHGPRVIGIVLSRWETARRGFSRSSAAAASPSCRIRKRRSIDAEERAPASGRRPCAAVARMGALLNRLAREASGAPSPIPDDIEREVALTARGVSTATDEAKMGELAPITCPECGGPLWDITESGLRRYRCRIGHVFAHESLIAEHAGALEQAMWAAVRGLQERGYVLAIRGADLRASGYEKAAERYERSAAEARVHAEAIRSVLLSTAAAERMRAQAARDETSSELSS